MQSKPGISRGRKWLYVLLGTGLAIVALSFGAGVVWWQQNGAAFGAEAEAAQRAGAAAGAETDQQGCLEQAARRHTEAVGVAKLGVTNSFLGTCLPAARQTPGFCAAPVSTGPIEIRTWRNDRCNALPEDLREACGTLIGSVQQICSRLNPATE